MRPVAVVLFIYLDHLYPTSELLLHASWCGDLPPGLGAQTRPFRGCCYFVAKFALVQQASPSTAWINVKGLHQSYQKLQEVAKSCNKILIFSSTPLWKFKNCLTKWFTFKSVPSTAFLIFGKSLKQSEQNHKISL